MKIILAINIFLLCFVSIAAAQRIEGNCVVQKLTTGMGSPAVFEDIAAFTFQDRLVAFDAPGASWLVPPLSNGLSNQARSFMLNIDGEVRKFSLNISLILVPPSRRTGERWGICQFRDTISTQYDFNGGSGSTQIQASQFGSQRSVQGKTTCEDVSIANQKWFSSSPAYAALPYGKENILVGCSYRLSNAHSVTESETAIEKSNVKN